MEVAMNAIKKQCSLGMIGFILNFFFLHVSLAGTVIFTGADLYSNSNATLHSGITSLSGSSLLFRSLDVPSSQYDKLVSLPMSSLGHWENKEGVVVNVSLNLTRRPCINASSQACSDREDHDIAVALGNGRYIVGAEIADNYNGSVFHQEFVDRGTYGTNARHDLLYRNTGFPDVGQSYVVNATFTLNSSNTLVDSKFMSGAGSRAGSALGRPSDLSFLLMRDNEPGEQYQLNSLLISSSALTPVPEPETVWQLFIGLACMTAFYRHKCSRKQSQS
jgi:hypothetical protein